MRDLPVIDVSPLAAGTPDAAASVGREIDAACRDTGFFYVTGHGVDPALPARVAGLAREFFALDVAEKATIAMARGGSAWRGWFPEGGELTSGVPDVKEGVYFGTELPDDDARVVARTPLHGRNLFPARPTGLREAVLAYLDALTTVGHVVLRGVAAGLGLDPTWFAAELTRDPTILFRIFRYPPTPAVDDGWGVAEHTDYGLLTILWQDDVGGLEVHGPAGWIDAAPVPGAFVCNIGDMLERMTGGRYRSTPHRVRNQTTADRVSLAFFLDPSWDASVAPLALPAAAGPTPERRARWDGARLDDIAGTYGEYLVAKVSKVFPQLFGDVLRGSGGAT